MGLGLRFQVKVGLGLRVYIPVEVVQQEHLVIPISPLKLKFCLGPRFRVHRGSRKRRISRRCSRRSSGGGAAAAAAPTVVEFQRLQHQCKYV